MDIELIEIRDFLAAHHPFDALPMEALDRLPSALSVRYLRRGAPLPLPDADRRDLCIVRQGAIEVRDRQGELTDKLGAGDLYAADCEGSHPTSARTCIAVEDTLLYLLACEQFSMLLRSHPAFARHFETTQAERLHNANALPQRAASDPASLLTTTVSSLVNRPPVFVSATVSIRDAAQRMAQARVSSLLVMDGDALSGLVTDRDLRNRCLAAGLDATRPVRDIMTTPVQTISASAPGFDALMRMTQLNVHHLPVLDAQHVVGVVTTTDLIRHESANAVYLVGDVRKAESVQALIDVGRQLPELQVQLALGSASAAHVGEAISAVNDAITRRLLALAEQTLGAPPVRYVWVTGGSHARREQTSHSDQDNALILADEATPADDTYFEALARLVNDGLNACGFIYCPGEVMASNPKWRQRYGSWQHYFDTWINQPEPLSLMLASVFFDLRAIHGDAMLLETLQKESLAQCRSNGLFLAYMARNAISNRPPLGFFRNIVLTHGGEHDKTFDIKHRGIVPVVDLARVYALAQGLPAINTLDRLRAAAGTQSVSAEGAQNLADAYEFIATLRVRHQARKLRAGSQADNYLAPDALSALERSHLKDAFAIIATMQQTLASRMSSGSLV